MQIRLDFSAFHPLDHRPGTRRCRGLPGGVRQHLRLAWLLDWRDQVLGPWRRVVCCRAGRHQFDVATVINGTSYRVLRGCHWCALRVTPSEADLDRVRTDPLLLPGTTLRIADDSDGGAG